MGERGVHLYIGVVFGVGSEGSGGLQDFLETEILEDSLGDEQVQLGVEAPAEVELHQHVATAFTVSALEEMFPRLGVLLHLPQTVGQVLQQYWPSPTWLLTIIIVPGADEGDPRESLCLYWTISSQWTDTSACQCYHRESTDTA